MEILFPDGLFGIGPKVRKTVSREKYSSGLQNNFPIPKFLNFKIYLCLTTINSETFLINGIPNSASRMANCMQNNYFLQRVSAMIIHCFIIVILQHRSSKQKPRWM